MKNQNLKTNKTKLIAKLMLVAVLGVSILNLTGCYKTPDGCYHPYDYDYYLSQKNNAARLRIWATSDKNVFKTDDISFNLIYGTHANEYLGRQDKKMYDLEDYLWYGTKEYEDYIFALYICDGDFRNTFVSDEYCIENIENIPDHEFIKSISAEEAFSEDYGYVVRNQILFPSLFYYKHIEDITIPKEYVKEDRGSFVIKFISYYKDLEKNPYFPSIIEYIIFEYKKVDENTVRINFREKDIGERQ